MGPAPTVVVRITRSQVQCLLAFAAVAVVALCLGTGLTYAGTIARNAWGGWGGTLYRAVSLGAENNLGAWYSSLLLLTVSLAWLACFAFDSAPGRRPGLRLGWLGLAALFAALSLDEAGSFHERLGALPGRSQLQVVAIPLAAVGLFMAAFAWARLRRNRTGLVLLGVAFACFASVPLQEHLVEGLRESGRYGSSWHSAAIDVVLEEGSELSGTFAFLAAALVYVRELAFKGRPARDLWLEAAVPLDSAAWFRAAVATVALLAAGFGAVEFAIRVLPSAEFKPGQLGSPSAWFAATLGVLVGVAALALARLAAARGAVERLRRLHASAGILSVVLAVHFGAGQLFSEVLFQGSARRVTVMRLVLAIGTLAAAAVGIWTARSRTRGAAVFGAGVLIAFALLRPEPVAGILAFAGFAVLGLGLVRTADEVVAFR